jgi:ribosomal-protein-alanine N-acetyltransferase
MGVLEFMPATLRVLRHLAADPEDFAEQYGIRLHELSQDIAEHSLNFLKSFAYETRPDHLGYLVFEGESQQMVGTCSFKGRPLEGVVEIAYYTLPGYEGRGIATEMAKFLLDRAAGMPEVDTVVAHTLPEPNASTRVLEKIGMSFAGDGTEDGEPVWRWEKPIASPTSEPASS